MTSVKCCALALLVTSCDPPRRAVTMDFVTNDVGDVKGFHCIDTESAEPGPLWYRGLRREGQDQFVRTNLVVDFIRLGGTPTCRPSQLLEWCEEEGCEPILESRVCYPLEVQLEEGERFGVTLDRTLSDLTGTSLIENTPDGDVLVRMVGTTQPCEDIDAGESLRCDSLIGCAHSCPTNLDLQKDALILDLDEAGTHCKELVELCASPRFTAESSCADG